MQRCEYCGSELPVNAQFCGNCGHMVADSFATASDITNPEATVITEPQTPPLFSSPMNPNMQRSGMGWQDTDSTFRTRWSVEDMQSISPQDKDRKTDENEAVLPDMLLPGMLAMRGQMSFPAQTPMVQGSPQFGGVPSVQGTPAAPGNALQSIPGPAHGAGSSAPSYAPQEPQSIPVHHQPIQHPWHHPQPTPPTHELEHKHPQHHHTGPLHKHKPRTSRLHSTAAATSKSGMGVVSKWLILIIAALVIIGSSSLFLAHELMASTPPPVLSVSGSTVVRDGGVFHLHGRGFQPGDGVTLTFDNGLPVTLAGQHGTQAVSQRAERNAQVAGLSQMNISGALHLQSAAIRNITVSSSGTFDASVTVPSGLPAGKHTIHATDNQSSQSATLQFTIPSPQLVVNPTALNFGSVEVGRTVRLSVTLSNQGGTSLLWTASVEGSNTNWLTLSNSSEVIGTNGLGQPVIVTADTNGLSVGSHTATLRFHSDNGYVQTTVNINVVSIAQSGQQAILNVPQQKLDFGQLQASQQTQQSISVANLGNLPLQWKANSDASSASWLSLATSKGTVQPGAVPQTVQVNVNTTGLVAGSYAGTISITSNGGNAQVGVTLIVTGSTVTPTPSPSPSPSPSPITTPTVTGISPASGSSTGGINVTINGTGFTGATSVSFGQTAANNVTVLSDTQITATNPAGNGTVDVTVTTPGGTSATSSSDRFTYTTVVLPIVTAINPNSGLNGGGTDVTIIGTGFTGATSVSFGQTAVSNFTVVSNTQITVTNPVGSGTVDVTVTTPTGTSATSTADQFTYTIPPPVVTGISPASGSSNGGTNVTVTGKGFNGATGVSFGKTPASNFNVVSDTQLTATSPAGSGVVDVIVTAPGGTSTTSSADQFTYTTPPPTVKAIKPNSGLSTGGTFVTIIGTDFTGATSVSFGQTAASNFTVVRNTQITVTSPVGSGTVDITVTTPGGTSVTSSADQFTYISAPIN